MQLIFHWVIAAVAIAISAYLLPGTSVDSLVTALIVAVVLGLANIVIKPILIILTLPVTLLTLGLFTFVINAFLVWLTSLVVPGFEVQNFGWALLFAILLSLIQLVFRQMEKKVE